MFEPLVRTHPRLVKAPMLAANTEGFDGRRRLLCHQPSLLQLDLLLQLNQHRRLHAIPESPTKYKCSVLNLFILINLKLHLRSDTYLEMIRPISSRQRQTCRGSLCSTRAENTTITRLTLNNSRKQLPLLLSIEMGQDGKHYIQKVTSLHIRQSKLFAEGLLADSCRRFKHNLKVTKGC